MKSIGQTLQEARLQKNFSLEKIENITRIKKEFIKNIENESWNHLPSFSVVQGFVKSIGAALDMDTSTLVAILKRDYPPKKVLVNPKPDISAKFVWSPKFTFFLGIGIILVLIIGYIGFQYTKFISPPKLVILSPTDDFKTNESSVIVSGKTEMDAKVVVNNEPVILDNDGGFIVKLNVSSQTKEIIVSATSRSGKVTQVSRKIKVE